MTEKQVSGISVEAMRADLEATKIELKGYEARLDGKRKWIARLEGQALSLLSDVRACTLLIETIEERIAEMGGE